jgi:N-acetylglucosamine-6-sulfatase
MSRVLTDGLQGSASYGEGGRNAEHREEARTMRRPIARGRPIVTLVILVGVLGTTMATIGAPPAAAARRPTIVLIVTDDQRADTLWAMPRVRQLLGARGITFTHGYVTNPLCCPSRATLLTGTYSHTNGVYTNDQSNHGGYAAFRDGRTVATVLHGAGYRTALVGKYINGYEGMRRIPPGWDRWFATFGEGAYFDFKVNDQGRIRAFGSRPADYGTTVVTHQAVRFVRSEPRRRPLFLYVAYHAPHEPAIPAPGDVNAFSPAQIRHGVAYDEAVVADKPPFIRRLRPLAGSREAGVHRFAVRQLETLLAVDRGVERIVDALRDTGRLANSLIVFTSDNGYLWGEHRVVGKNLPYEESIGVPFVVRYDARVAAPRSDPRSVLNLDVAPTFAAAAGTRMPGTDGRSFLPLLSSATGPWREAFLVEHLRYAGKDIPTFCTAHTDRFVYTRYGTGFRELYDLRRDPGELENVVGAVAYRTARANMSKLLARLCRPVPPGFGVRL